MRLFLVLFFIPILSFAEVGADTLGSTGRLELAFNDYRYGEATEFGYISKSLFQFSSSSRHYWSIFSTVGMNTVTNAAVNGRAQLENEILNIEAAVGLFAQGKFYKDFIVQYGKVAFDYVHYDEDINSDPGVGGLLESGLEFHSDAVKFGLSSKPHPISAHIGIRWRVLFDKVDGLIGEPDVMEGISFVVGVRVSL